MPFVPELSAVTLESNGVRSFQAITKRLGITIPPGRLRVLNLGKFKESRGYWLVRHSMDENRNIARPYRMPKKGWKEELLKEREAIQTFLCAYRELQTFIRSDEENGSFGGSFRIGQELHGSVRIPEQLYQMEINSAGRILVEGSRNIQKSNDPKSLAASVWPRILERAWKWQEPLFYTLSRRQERNLDCYSRPTPTFKTGDNPTCDGIYYLLRNVDVLKHVSQREPVAIPSLRINSKRNNKQKQQLV